MGTNVEQSAGEDKVRFEMGEDGVYLRRKSQRVWIAPRDEACEAMAEFLAQEDFGE